MFSSTSALLVLAASSVVFALPQIDNDACKATKHCFIDCKVGTACHSLPYNFSGHGECSTVRCDPVITECPLELEVVLCKAGYSWQQVSPRTQFQCGKFACAPNKEEVAPTTVKRSTPAEITATPSSDSAAVLAINEEARVCPRNLMVLDCELNFHPVRVSPLDACPEFQCKPCPTYQADNVLCLSGLHWGVKAYASKNTCQQWGCVAESA